jgi:hypothetical protein
MKTTLTWLFWLAVIGGGVAWYFIHQHQTQKREQRAAEIQKQQTDASIAALTLKYSAVTNWEASLPDRGAQEHFSIDVSRALIGSNQEPVFLVCFLKDIVEKDRRIIARLSSVDIVISLSLELECSPGQSKVFTGTNQLTSFGVIARCHEVQRLSGDDEGFSVKGELLDAIQLP